MAKLGIKVKTIKGSGLTRAERKNKETQERMWNNAKKNIANHSSNRQQELDKSYNDTLAYNDDAINNYIGGITSQLNSNAAQQRAYYQNLYNEDARGINTNFDRSANNAYVNYRQNQKALPERLSQYGINGGASESANLKLQAAYGTNLANNEYERNNQLGSARRSMNSSINAVDADLNSALANAYAQGEAQRMTLNNAARDKYQSDTEQLKLETTNRERQARESYLKGIGYTTEGWYGNDGQYHWEIIKTAQQNKADKKAAEAAEKAANEAAAKAYKEAYTTGLMLADAGYNVTYKNGVPYVSGKKKLTSGNSSGGGSGSGSSSGGSNSVAPAKEKKNTSKKSPSKKAGDLNYGKVLMYTNSNASKMISDPYSVVTDLKKKIKSGYFTEAEANAIYAKMPSLKK